jgi:hypothetical protein
VDTGKQSGYRETALFAVVVLFTFCGFDHWVDEMPHLTVDVP